MGGAAKSTTQPTQLHDPNIEMVGTHLFTVQRNANFNCD